jgi:signal transduction histidine kinase
MRLANMAESKLEREYDFSIATMSPTSEQRRAVIILIAILIVAFGAVAPFASSQLPRSNGFVPTVEAINSVTALATAVLLFSQYSITGLSALLILASGYLFSSMIIIPHVLSYPGAFAPHGLFAEGIQATPWLYTFWHFGLSIAVLAYAYMKDQQLLAFLPRTPGTKIVWRTVVLILVSVAALTWLLVSQDRFLPPLLIDELTFAPLANYVTAATLLICGVALVLLIIRQRSVLDLWLIVAMFATVFEQAVVTLLIVRRFSLGFYSSRVFSVVVSAVVLVALLSETVRLYARLARANRMLERERASKLMNLEVAVAAVTHEIRQPLTAIATRGAAARRLLARTPPENAKIQTMLEEMTGATFRASEVLESMRALFRNTDQQQDPCNLNEIAFDALRTLESELNENGITTKTRLDVGLPKVLGHKGQLQEVVLNLIQNSIEAMANVEGKKTLTIETNRPAPDEISICIQDTGRGFELPRTSGMFEAFFTTKPNGMGGMGLAISQMIVDRHGGRISASAAAPRGARFQVVLPIKP